MKPVASKSRQQSQKGNTLIEATAVTLLLLGLLFLVVDLGLALFTKATLQAAVQAGVRYAVTERVGSGQTYLNDSIIQVVQQNAMGMLNGNNGACKISINYYNPVTGAASNGSGGDVIKISVNNYQYTPVGILKSGSPITLTASSSDVMEQCPLGGCPPIANPTPPACP